MIYTDEDGIVNVEYGHGSIMGMTTEKGEDGYVNMCFASTDPEKIGTPCKNFNEIEGKPDCDAGISVRLRFNNIESLNIFMDDMAEVRKTLSS
jgi:hypothetical protein